MLTTKDFAKEFNVTLKTVRNWIDSGSLKAVKIDGTIRIPQSEMDRLKDIEKDVE